MGGIIGGILGGGVGFLVGGPTGAAIGASIGSGLGTWIDPLTPDVSGLGETEKISLPTAAEGAPVADCLGVAKTAGQFLWYCCSRSKEIESSSGKSDSTVTGYNYYLSWAVGLCAGPVDELLSVWMGDECVWCGELKKDADYSVLQLGTLGRVVFYFGNATQSANTTITSKLGTPAYSPAYRGLCYAFFDDCLIGNSNRVPDIHFVFRKSPRFDFSPYEQIDKYRYNPAHAIWYVLSTLAGVPESMLDASSFAASAQKLFNESHGVGVLLDNQASALSYIESLLSHVGGVLRYGADGKLHLHLVRNNDDYWDLPQIEAKNILEHPEISSKSWLDTINEVKVQYPQLYFGDWVAGHEVRDCDGAAPPTLTQCYCGPKICLELTVVEFSESGLEITVDRDLEDYGMVDAVLWVNGDSYPVSVVAGATITVGSEIADLANGLPVALQTGDDYQDGCQHQGIFHVEGGTEPYHLYFRHLPNGKWTQTKVVKSLFVQPCTPVKCQDAELAIHDACGQDSCDLTAESGSCLTLVKSCDCGGASFSGGTHEIMCGETLNFRYQASDAECCSLTWQLVGVGTISQTAVNRVTYTAPGPNGDGCCYDPAELSVLCCGTVVGTATITVNCGCSSASIGYTTPIMELSEEQTLDIDNASDTCSYDWALVSGGGSLDVAEDGLSAVYTAPSSNANCDNNATISLLCCDEIIDTIVIAVNAKNYNAPAFCIKHTTSCEVLRSATPPYVYYTYYVGYADFFNCDGTFRCTTNINKSDWGYDPGGRCAEFEYTSRTDGHCYSIYSAIVGAPETVIDLRTPAMVAAGCCPF